MGEKKNIFSAGLGSMLFVAGWALMAYSIAGRPSMKMNQKSMIAYGGALGVVIAVMAMKNLPLSAQIKKAFGILFIAAWVAVAISVGMGKSNRAKMYGYFALANVLGSMLFVLPFARKRNIVDNPGMFMFGLTFISLAIANSL